MKKLKYEKYNNSNSVLMIDLHNGYTIVSLSGYDLENGKYKTSLYLKANNVDDWRLIEKAEKLEFDATPQTINMAILKTVGGYLESGFFDYYINRYEYEMKCFDKGNEFFEKGRVCDKSCISCDYWDVWDDCK